MGMQSTPVHLPSYDPDQYQQLAMVDDYFKIRSTLKFLEEMQKMSQNPSEKLSPNAHLEF